MDFFLKVLKLVKIVQSNNRNYFSYFVICYVKSMYFESFVPFLFHSIFISFAIGRNIDSKVYGRLILINYFSMIIK
jgi:hypothetical protein